MSWNRPPHGIVVTSHSCFEPGCPGQKQCRLETAAHIENEGHVLVLCQDLLRPRRVVGDDVVVMKALEAGMPATPTPSSHQDLRSLKRGSHALQL
eukprot:335853-Rhodomonas_salina.1